MLHLRKIDMRKEIIQKIALLFAFPILTAAGLSDNFGKEHVVINEICHHFHL